MESFEEFSKSIIVAMTTYNRKSITKLCVENITKYKGLSSVCIFDDYSTDYTQNDIKSWGNVDSVNRLYKKMGIEDLRVQIHKIASSLDFKYIYHIDNDAYHDPDWLKRLYELRSKHNGLIGLYNSKFHENRTIENFDDYILRSSCPGISYFYEIAKLGDVPTNFGKRCWDYAFGDKLAPAAISTISYVEHLGADGVHNRDFDRDRACNPTEWLIKERARILDLISKQEL
jgi:hypothetical protein